MIVGNGNIAKVLKDRDDLVFFASGVSNSSCTDEKEYERELFIAGAKWQAERMYSEEDMRTAIFKSFLLGVDRGIYSKELEDKLIEQSKNK